MHMHRKAIAILIITAIVLVMLTLVGCGSKEKQSEGSAKTAGGEGQKYVMRIGAPTSGKHPQNYVMEQFKNRLESKIGSAIKVELYPSGQLGSNSQMLQALQGNSIQGLLEPPSFLGGLSNVILVADLPYFFPDTETAVKILSGPEGDKLRTYVQKKGILMKGFFVISDRVILCKTPLTNMDSFKGKKIRVMGGKVLQDEINAWGGKAVPMDVPELYTALQQGTIDGIEADTTFFLTNKYYELAKYVLMAPKGAMVSIFMVNESWLEGLPGDLKEAVASTINEVCLEGNTYGRNFTRESLENLKNAGVKIEEPSTEFNQELQKAAQAVHESFLKDNPDARPIYDALKAGSSQTR